MRILLLTSTFYPLHGGAESYARLLAEGLAALGHEIVVVTDGSWVSAPASEDVDGYSIERLGHFAKAVEARDRVRWRQMQYSVLDELGPLLAQRSFDVIHANSHETLALGAMISLTKGAALVASLHEQSPHLEAFGVGRCLLSYRILPVDLFLAASQFYFDRALAFGVSAERVRLIYHGVRTTRTRPQSREEVRQSMQLHAADTLVVCAGRIHPRKGQIYLARALPAIRSAFPRVRVLLAGRVSDFGYERELRNIIAAHGLDAAVALRPDLTEDDMPAIFSAADIVVQPSLEEGLGLAAIEAMAAARPVVATNVVGLREVIQHGVDGMLVAARDPNALAAAITELCRSPRRAERLGAAARRTVLRRFDQRQMARATAEAYAEAYAGRASRIGQAALPLTLLPSVSA